MKSCATMSQRIPLQNTSAPKAQRTLKKKRDWKDSKSQRIGKQAAYA